MRPKPHIKASYCQAYHLFQDETSSPRREEKSPQQGSPRQGTPIPSSNKFQILGSLIPQGIRTSILRYESLLSLQNL